MTNKVLIVDDEVNVLEGFRRQLCADFEIITELSGDVALKTLKKNGPFAVIVSDMRMPGMDGVRLLNEFSRIAPDTVRIMLTGCTDRQTAIDAVNQGNIFRFLTKPCPTESLKKAIEEGLEQYKMISGGKGAYRKSLEELMSVEKKLLEQQILLDTLSEAIFMLDVDLQLSEWNSSLKALSGQSSKDLHGKAFVSFFSEGERTSVSAMIRELFKDNAGRMEASWIAGDGRVIPVLLSTAALKDESGIVVGFVGSVHDLTEHKNLRTE